MLTDGNGRPIPQTLHRWSVEPCADQERQPAAERDHIHLVGVRDGEAKLTLTSRVVAVDGRLVTTGGRGKVYRLGDPDLEYLRQLALDGVQYDPANPIKLPAPPAAEGAQ